MNGLIEHFVGRNHIDATVLLLYHTVFSIQIKKMTIGIQNKFESKKLHDVWLKEGSPKSSHPPKSSNQLPAPLQ